MVLYKSVNCVGRSRNSADWTSRPNFGPACLAGLPDEWIAVLKTSFEKIDGDELVDLKPRTPQRNTAEEHRIGTPHRNTVEEAEACGPYAGRSC